MNIPKSGPNGLACFVPQFPAEHGVGAGGGDRIGERWLRTRFWYHRRPKHRGRRENHFARWRCRQGKCYLLSSLHILA